MCWAHSIDQSQQRGHQGACNIAVEGVQDAMRVVQRCQQVYLYAYVLSSALQRCQAEQE